MQFLFQDLWSTGKNQEIKPRMHQWRLRIIWSGLSSITKIKQSCLKVQSFSSRNIFFCNTWPLLYSWYCNWKKAFVVESDFLRNHLKKCDLKMCPFDRLVPIIICKKSKKAAIRSFVRSVLDYFCFFKLVFHNLRGLWIKVSGTCTF